MTEFDVDSFRQRFPWWGGDLQTIATSCSWCAAPKKPPPVSERQTYTLHDGDTLFAMLDSPVSPKPDRPLVVLIHGMPGSEDSSYMLRMSSYLVGRDHRVLRLNLRGAGPSRPQCKCQYYAGSSRDLFELLDKLPQELAKPGIAVVGYSLGGAILLKYLGEQGKNTPVVAAASVSAPIDLFGTCRNLLRFRNTLYHWRLFSQIKREATAEGAVLSKSERDAIEASQNLWQYDDRFTGPRNGCKDAAEYYSRDSAIKFLPGIRIPTLVLASQDDPWVPGGAYVGHRWGPNLAHQRERASPGGGAYVAHRQVPSKPLPVKRLLPTRGGHVGFHGRGQTQPWSDVAIEKFFASLRA